MSGLLLQSSQLPQVFSLPSACPVNMCVRVRVHTTTLPPDAQGLCLEAVSIVAEGGGEREQTRHGRRMGR